MVKIDFQVLNIFQFFPITFLGSNWFHADELDYDGTATMVPKREFIKIVKVHQIEKDAILVCYGNQLQIVNMQGHPKQPKKMISSLTFDFNIESVGKLIAS